MLVLTRKVEESVLIGDNIEIKVLQVRGTGRQASIRIGIVAPEGIRVLRKEVLVETAEENRRAAMSGEPDFSKINIESRPAKNETNLPQQPKKLT
jgi:carbon storage regulator